MDTQLKRDDKFIVLNFKLANIIRCKNDILLKTSCVKNIVIYFTINLFYSHKNIHIKIFIYSYKMQDTYYHARYILFMNNEFIARKMVKHFKREQQCFSFSFNLFN